MIAKNSVSHAFPEAFPKELFARLIPQNRFRRPMFECSLSEMDRCYGNAEPPERKDVAEARVFVESDFQRRRNNLELEPVDSLRKRTFRGDCGRPTLS